MQDDLLGFAVRCTAEVTFPVSPQVVLQFSCTVAGEFTSDTPVSDELYDTFQNRESFILLWPYVRSFVGEMSRILALELPPLPTVDMRRFFGLEDELEGDKSLPEAVELSSNPVDGADSGGVPVGNGLVLRFLPSLWQLTVDEPGAGADDSHQVWSVDPSPAGFTSAGAAGADEGTRGRRAGHQARGSGHSAALR